MTSFSEIVHSQNVESLDKLISIIQSFGTRYRPREESLRIDSLKGLLYDSHTAIKNVRLSVANYASSVTQRELSFSTLSQIVDSICSSLSKHEADEAVLDKLNLFSQQFKLKRVKLNFDDISLRAIETGKSVKEVTQVQSNYDNKISQFEAFIKLLENLPSATKLEKPLRVDALKIRLEDMKRKNQLVVNAAKDIKQARIGRSDIIYKMDLGLIDTALDVKVYVKSIFGAKSNEWKYVSALEFKRL